MKKKMIAALVLMCFMLTSTTAFAAWSPADFSGGSLSGITADENDLLVSDVKNKVVWRITPNNVELEVGKIGVSDISGEPIGSYVDGTLSSAMFLEPWAIAPFLDGFAVTDAEANVVRYFDNKGVFTAAGSGEAGKTDGTSTKVSFDNPTGLAAGDKGKLYIADTNNGSIRVMDEDGDVTTLITGLVEPTGLCWYDGKLYVAETGRNRILKVSGSNYEVVAGGNGTANDDGYYAGGYVDGELSKARFDHPQGVAVGANGAIYVADTGNGAVRKIYNGRVDTLASASNEPGSVVQPRGMLVQGNTLLVTDIFTQNVLKIDTTPMRYNDVPADAWYAAAVRMATERGIVGGTAANTFSPNEPVTRGMLAVMLSRMYSYSNGSVVINGSASFTDVADGAWYTNAVRWAADNNIVGGYPDGSYAPNQDITREQLTVMLWRYAGCPMSNHDLSQYNDADSISDYAVNAVKWGNENGVINGKGDGNLDPQGKATRAEVVAMLMRMM